MNMQRLFNKHILFLLLATILLSTNLFAQDPPPPPPDGGERPQGEGRPDGPPSMPDSTQIVKMVDELSEELALSDEQKAQLVKLHIAHFDTLKEMREKNRDDREGGREAMRASMEAFDGQVKALLTDEQKTKYDEIRKNRRRGPGGPPPRR